MKIEDAVTSDNNWFVNYPRHQYVPWFVDRSARMALENTGNPQTVHMHREGETCVRGGCYLLRRNVGT